MKTTIQNLFLLSLLAGLASCASDDLLNDPSDAVVGNTDSEIRQITVTLPTIEVEEGVASTRNQFINMGTADWNAVWAEGDTLGIFPSSGGQVEFAVTDFGSNTSVFNGGGWALKSAETYAAYYPFDKHNVYVTNQTIPLDYTGQVQQGNGNYDHLGGYDFLASKAMPRSGNSLNFELLRQGYIICLTLTVPATDTYTAIDLVSSYPQFVTKAELDISSTTAPAVTAKEESNTIRLSLQDVSLFKNETLTAYMMAFPVGSVTPMVVLHGKKGTYEGAVDRAMNMTRNKMAIRSATLTDAMLHNLSLIAAAEANEGVDFTQYKDAMGRVPLNNANVIAMLKKVKTIDVTDKGDPTVCDEIDYFPNLETLKCSGNGFLAIDLSNNLKLKYLDCSNNQLHTLDVSMLRDLYYLNCSGTSVGALEDLDVSHNQALTSLYCNGIGAKRLDVTHNPELLYLECNDNIIQSLDLFYNTKLLKLDCKRNILYSLDVCDHASLTSVTCTGNPSLSSLNLTNCSALTSLDCAGCNLRELDVSTNTALSSLWCYSNELESLDVSNNTNLNNLNCSYNNFTTLAIQTDEMFLNKLTYLNVSHCGRLQELYVAGDFSADLSSSTGNLKTLIVDNCEALKSLNCSGNKIESLEVNTLINLDQLQCHANWIQSLDVSENTKLYWLSCYSNLMSSLDITNCTNLRLYETVNGQRRATYCGSQWSTIYKNTPKTLTLKHKSSQGTTLDDTNLKNKNVTRNVVY